MATEEKKTKDIEIPLPNGSLMLAWQVKNKHVLVVGGGDVAISRVNHLLQADAKITIVATKIDPLLHKYSELGLIYKLIERPFKFTDLKMYDKSNNNRVNNFDIDGELSQEDMERIEEYEMNSKFAMVLTAIDNHELSSKIYYKCKLLNLNVNIADRPKQCDFYFGSVIRKGSLQIMISSNGKSPRFCNKLKTQIIEPSLSKIDLDKSIDNLGYLRENLKTIVKPGDSIEIIKERIIKK